MTIPVMRHIFLQMGGIQLCFIITAIRDSHVDHEVHHDNHNRHSKDQGIQETPPPSVINMYSVAYLTL